MVRHGESEDNVKRVYGSDFSKLSLKGVEQVKMAKENLKNFSYKRVYYSPLTRTKETLQYLELEGRKDWRIRELDFGIFAGKNYEEIQELFPEEVMMWNENQYNYVIPQGESLIQNYERVKEFLEEIIEEDEDVLLVTHAGVIRLVFSWVFDNPEYFFKFKVKNASINIVSIEDSYKYIKLLNYNPKNYS